LTAAVQYNENGVQSHQFIQADYIAARKLDKKISQGHVTKAFFLKHLTKRPHDA